MQVNSKNRIHLDSECNLEVKGTNNVIYVGKSVCNPLLSDQKLQIKCLGDNNYIYVDKGVTYGIDCSILATNGAWIYVGRDAMFSNEVKIINFGGKISIGNHVWLGLRSCIVDNAWIGDGAIVGACTKVKGFFENNTMIVGNPCRIIKENIAWARERDTKEINRIPVQYRMNSKKQRVSFEQRKKMKQEIITIGSKLLDDLAIASTNKIINKKRITDISPLSFCGEWDAIIPKDELNILLDQMVFKNEYSKEMFLLDFGRKVGEVVKNCKEEYYILFDVSCLRLPVHKFIFQNDKTIFLTENDSLNNNKEQIVQFYEKYYGKLKKDEIINMFKCSDEKMKELLERFVSFLSMSKAKIVCVEIQFSSVYISRHNTIEILDKQNVIFQTNKFFNKIQNFLPGSIECIKIPSYVYGDERLGIPHMLSFNSTYLKYLAEAVLDIDNKDTLLEKCNVEQMARFSDIMMRPLAYQVNMKYKNRKIIIIGENKSLEYLLAKEYGIKTYKIIPYDEKMDEQQISVLLQDIKGKDSDFYCVIPSVYNGNVIRALWKNGYGFGIGYYAIIHTPYKLENFVGHYEDCFNNIVDTKIPLTVELRGAGTKIVVETSGGRNNLRMVALSGIDCHIAENVEIERDYSLRMYDGAKLSIDSGTHLGESGHIRGSFNTTTHVGADVKLGKDVIIFNGDGHAIIDLHSGDNINYAYDKSKESNHVIEIEKGCVLKDNTFVLSGTHLKENTIVEADSFVNSNYEKDRRN